MRMHPRQEQEHNVQDSLVIKHSELFQGQSEASIVRERTSMSDQQVYAEARLRAKAAFLAQGRATTSTIPQKRRKPLEVTPADSTSPTQPNERHFASTSDSTAKASDAFQRAVTPGSGVAGRSASAALAGSSKGLGISGGPSLVGPTRSYVDYDLSTLKNSKGGFLVDEEEDNERELKQRQQVEELRKQRLRELERKGAMAEDPALTADRNAHARCEGCGSVELDFQIHRIFGVAVCPKCKHDHPDRYSLLTKTECKEDYLLTDPELKDAELLPHLLKPNPHRPTYSNMMLFLRKQVEDFAFKKWGSAEALDGEFARREAEKKKKKGKKFEAKLADLRRKTRTNRWHQRKDDEHVHDFGGNDTIRDADGNQVQICKICGFEVAGEVF